ncbi:MAG: YaiI/YqxD family protein [Planctomycetes bacterium]|nr:YaiI/YqxD family protein [Planctomycetota bacterium]
MLQIFIDADACPVRHETYRVAQRYELMVWVVANQWMDMPDDPSIRLEVVNVGFDAADDWIVEHVERGDIVITDDIPLSARCLEKDARVLTNRGEVRSKESIGAALAMRELMQYMRDSGESKGGQKPLQEKDRRYFLQELDKLVHSVKKYG